MVCVSLAVQISQARAQEVVIRSDDCLEGWDIQPCAAAVGAVVNVHGAVTLRGKRVTAFWAAHPVQCFEEAFLGWGGLLLLSLEVFHPEILMVPWMLLLFRLWKCSHSLSFISKLAAVFRLGRGGGYFQN